MVCDAQQSQVAFTHQIWNSYLKGFWRYAPDANPILENRSEVKVTVTQAWYATLCHSQDACTSNLGFLTQIIREICFGHEYSKNVVRGQCQDHIDPKKVYDTPPSKDTPTHKLWDSCLNNTGDMLRTQLSYKLGQRSRSRYFKTEEHLHPET